MSEDVDDVLNVVQRWESLGLLEGLPIQERVELAQIYDNATKLLLLDLTLKRIPKKISDILDEIYIPVCRRLYRRVGPNFNLEKMMSELLEVVNKDGDEIISVNSDTPEKNPIVNFCVGFADNYEDEETSKIFVNEEDYQIKVGDLLTKLKEILLNEETVSYVSKEDDGYKLNIANVNRTNQQRRFWNQSVAKQFLNSVLSEINKNE